MDSKVISFSPNFKRYMFNWLKSLIGANAPEKEVSPSATKGLEAFDEGNDLLSANDFESALKYYDISIHHNIEMAYEQRAICLQALKFHFDALEDFDIAISLSPDDCNIYFMRAWSRTAVGQFEGALSDIKEAIRFSKINNQRNDSYNKPAKELGHANITETYSSHLPLFERMAKRNGLMAKKYEPLNVKRRFDK